MKLIISVGIVSKIISDQLILLKIMKEYFFVYKSNNCCFDFNEIKENDIIGITGQIKNYSRKIFCNNVIIF